MTVGIAAICKDSSGLVIAADAMITNPALSLEFEHQERKIIPLAESCVALTAGDALAHTELCNRIRPEIGQLKEPSVAKVVDQAAAAYRSVREKRIKEEVLNPRGIPSFEQFYQMQRVLVPEVAMTIQSQIDQYNYGLEIIIAGISDGRAHIYGVFNPGASRCFDAIGFHAIGSGSPHVLNTLILRNQNQSTPLADTVMHVYEAKRMAERAPGVGAKITDISIMLPGKTIPISRDKVDDLKTVYTKWSERQSGWREQLQQLMTEIGAASDEPRTGENT